MARKQEILTDVNEAPRTVATVGIDKIDLDVDNHRAAMDPEKLNELAESMKTFGLQQPIGVNDNFNTVVSGDGRATLIWGHRRLCAAKMLGWSKIEAVVYTGLTALQIAELQAIENLQREDLSPADEARAVKALIDAGQDVEQVAARIERSASWCRRRLDLLRLCPEVLALVATGRIPVKHGQIITRLAGRGEQLAVAWGCMGHAFYGTPARDGKWAVYARGEKGVMTHRRITFVEGAEMTDHVASVRELREEVGKRLRTLTRVWTLDAEYAGRRACAGCKDNSATEPTLFEGISDHAAKKSEKGHCGNVECYGVKARQLEKDRDKRKKDRKAKAAETEKKRAYRKKNPEPKVCWRCDRGRKDSEEWPEENLCPRCKAKIDKDADREKAKAEREASRYGRSSDKPEVVAARKAFPATPAEKYAVASWKYARTIVKALKTHLKGKTALPEDLLAQLVAFRWQNSGRSWYGGMKEQSTAAIAKRFAGGKPVTIDRAWIAAAFGHTFDGTLRNGPRWEEYWSEASHVPLPARHNAFIDCIEHLARRWGVTVEATRPKKADFKAVAEKKKKSKALNAKAGKNAKAEKDAKADKGRRKRAHK